MCHLWRTMTGQDHPRFDGDDLGDCSSRSPRA
jgi:hypothetical protein